MAAKAKLNTIEIDKLQSAMKAATGMSLPSIRKAFAEAERGPKGSGDDLAHSVAKQMLKKYFANGTYLIRAMDRSFWRYSGKHWERTTDEQIRNKILSIVNEKVVAGQATYASTVRAALDLTVAMQAAEGDILRLTEEPPPVINCQNGELWIASDGNVELRPHSHSSYLTYVLDVEYDPAATCPRFDQALLDIFRDSSDPIDMARHIEEFVGYAVQPVRDIASWFMLRGKGRNGKTKLIETVERLVNKSAVYSDRLANIEKDKFAVGALAGKLLLIDDDVDTGTRLPDGFIKKVSERKLMTGQLKFKDSFEFVCIAMVVMLANNPPFSADLSQGLLRRAQIIPFDRVFTDDDADNTLFPYIWEHEMSGILNRAIEGLARLRQRGRFAQPIDCVHAVDDWLNHANPLKAFIDEKCSSSVSANAPLKVLYKEFQDWAEESGIRGVPSKSIVKANLANLGYDVRKQNTGQTVFGLAVDGHYFDPQDM